MTYGGNGLKDRNDVYRKQTVFPNKNHIKSTNIKQSIKNFFLIISISCGDREQNNNILIVAIIFHQNTENLVIPTKIQKRALFCVFGIVAALKKEYNRQGLNKSTAVMEC